MAHTLPWTIARCLLACLAVLRDKQRRAASRGRRQHLSLAHHGRGSLRGCFLHAALQPTVFSIPPWSPIAQCSRHAGMVKRAGTPSDLEAGSPQHVPCTAACVSYLTLRAKFTQQTQATAHTRSVLFIAKPHLEVSRASLLRQYCIMRSNMLLVALVACVLLSTASGEQNTRVTSALSLTIRLVPASSGSTAV